MQIKTLDGVMHEVSPAQVQRVYKMLPAHASKQMKVQQDVELEQVLETFDQKSQKYMQKAGHNIKRIVQLQALPTTEDDVKSALAHVLCHGCPERIADALYESIQFQVSRFMKHLVDEYME